MKKEEIKIEKYVFERNNQNYFLYLVPSGETVDLVLSREGYSNYECEVGLLFSDKEKFEEVIEGNIDLWIEDYNMSINE